VVLDFTEKHAEFPGGASQAGAAFSQMGKSHLQQIKADICGTQHFPEGTDHLQVRGMLNGGFGHLAVAPKGGVPIAG
jgi:hypothetical protein